MREQVTGKTALYWYDSLHELGQYLEQAPVTWTASSSQDRTHKPAQSWDLGLGYEGAVKLAKQGWLEGAQRAQEALKSFNPMTPAPVTKTDFYGYMPHVPRFCAGAPDSMIRHARPPREGFGKVLTLIVPCNAISSVGAKYMANFGLAVAQYVNQLEMDRVRINIIGLMVSQLSEYRLAHAWQIKQADQPLDLAILAFAIGHPAMFRRLGFGLRERSCVSERYGYGSTVEGRTSDVMNCPINAYVLNGMGKANSIAKTPEAALAYIEAEINKAMERKAA